MAIPDYQSIMLPLLRFLGDGEVRSKREAVQYLADEFKLSNDEQKELLPSGKQRLFDNRVGWARTYQLKAGLIESVKHGYFKISERGKGVLSQDPKKIDAKYLEKFPEFVEFKKLKKSRAKKTDTVSTTPSDVNPEETLETAFQELQDNLSSDLLQTIKDCSPEFFERLVIDVLIKMGYGGSRKEAGQAMGKSGDGGIDGIIKEDKLGLDII
jgi:restriction system protein